MLEVQDRERAVAFAILSDDDAADQYSLAELADLVHTAGGTIIDTLTQNRDRPDRATYMGKGKVEELLAITRESSADLVIVNGELSPTQLRNLSKALDMRVIDRTQLILDIFAQRAHTSEGKLQVELAQMKYLLPRITSVYTQFERQQGGIGQRGPGETKLEADRRRIRKRIDLLEDELDAVRQHRRIQKKSRKELPFHSGVLVGYTSAGKSTLLNTLSGSDVYADPQLFATLDPTTRRVALPDARAMMLTDTVGFIQNLPHDLVAAFRATLEEVTESDFLIHVVDCSHPQMDTQIAAVNQVLKELDALDKPTVTVFNKSDLLKDQYELRRLVADRPNSVYVSALTGEGIDQLIALITKVLQSLLANLTLRIPYDRSDLVALCHESGRVLNIEYTPEAIIVEAQVSHEVAGRLKEFAENAPGDGEETLKVRRRV